MNIRTTFLIGAGGAALHLSLTAVVVLCAGYGVCSVVDDWFADRQNKKKARRRIEALDDELSGWKKDPDDAEAEIKGDWSRIRLDGQFQILAARVSQMLIGLEAVDLIREKSRKASSAD